MKKVLTRILFASLLLGAGLSAQAQRVNSANGANLRNGPGTGYAVNTSIPNGAKVKVVEKSSSQWYKVEYNGQTGYVSADLIESDNKAQQASSSNDNRTASNDNRSNHNTSNPNSNSHHNSSSNRTASHSSPKKSSASSSSGSSSRNWGVGLRLGEPSGVSVKKYFGGKNALEISLGRSARWGYRYDDEDFYEDDRYRDRDYYYYGGYKGGYGTSLQVHYLWQKPIAGVEGLDWYFGLGGQARFTPVTYYYYYNEFGWDRDDWRDWRYVSDRRTDIDLGVDGVIGVEYTFPNAPISVFADANLFLEVVDAPLFMFGQGGVGVRYNF